MKKTIKSVATYDPDYLSQQLSQLISQGFSAKFTHQLFSKKTATLAIKVISDYLVMSQQHTLAICEIEGQICGCLLISEDPNNLAHLYHFFRRSLTVMQSLKLLFLMVMLSYRPQKNEGYIDLVVTDQKFYRLGVAQSLIEHSMAMTSKQHLTLHVAESNRQAIKLYEKLNFKRIKHESSRLLYWLTGKKGWYLMRWENEKN